MRALLIILSALGAAFLVMSFVRGWQIRKAIKCGLPPEAVDNNYILGAFVGLVVFAIGAVWLELNSAAPNTTYVPAKIRNGAINGGEFEQRLD
jgi:biotin transporter BioY